MSNVPPDLLNLLIQGGFAALFIWLLFRTQDRQDKREDKLMLLLQDNTNKLRPLESLPDMAKALHELTRALERLEKRLEAVEEKVGSE